jgi:D-alanine-D-alanine ligase
MTGHSISISPETPGHKMAGRLIRRHLAGTINDMLANNTKKSKANLSSKTLGPLADLEAHLPEDWWHKLFNALYLKTDGDVVENYENTQREVDFIENATSITKKSDILDLCCGQGRHVLELSQRGYKKTIGLDRSRYLVRLAKKRATEAGLKVKFKEGDARNPRLRPDSFDCVTLMGNSFGYFSNIKDDEKILMSIAKLLRQSGSLVLDLADGDWLRENFEARSWEWIDKHHFVCRERSLAVDGDRLISREVITHDEKGVLADQFYAERLYSKQTISDVLKQLGFRSIRFHAAFETNSDRDQDLGMMARRLLLTASSPLKQKKSTKGSKANLKVAVLLGDPSLPDRVKPEGKFNPEDLETVYKLKDALSDLKSFDFTFLDNHTSLHRDLNESRPDLIFNLCDEGFNNDSFKELHVPASLELMDLPYTGAPPGCLAISYDKALVRALAAQLDIPVPNESYVRPDDQMATLPSVFPALLKPNFGDSSEGITKNSVVDDQKGLIDYLEFLRSRFPKRPVLVQEFLSGKEYSVALIGNPRQGLLALPLLEVDYSNLDKRLPQILGYESKWLPRSPYWTQIKYRESDASEQIQAQLINYSKSLFERLQCRDYARFDYRADDQGTIKLLEVNPNPGWCWDGKMNLMAEYNGWSYTEFLEQILFAACERLNLT